MKLMRKVVAVLVALMLVASMCIGALAENTFDITVKDDEQNTGKKVFVEWKDYDYSAKAFKVYRSTDGTRFDTVGVDYTEAGKVRVLQLYPYYGQLKGWIQNEDIGKNVIEVTEVPVWIFKNNPTSYLYKEANGDWNYDVVYFGSWDGNDGEDISSSALELMRKFAADGKGIVFGHDVIASNNNHTKFGNFGILGKELLPEVELYIPKYDEFMKIGGYTNVEITRNSIFTNYPNDIGPKGTILTVPLTHQFGQWFNDQDKYAYMIGRPTGPDDTYQPSSDDPYLFVKGNVALIQTGHSGGSSTEDERKVIANLCFFLNQLVFNTFKFTDASAYDEAAPDKPTAQSTSSGDVAFASKDNGTEYDYYVKSYANNDLQNELATSNTVQKSVTSGLNSYVYMYDNVDATEIKNPTGLSKIATDDTFDIVANAGKNAYFHIAALDNVDNLSKTLTISVADAFKEKYAEIIDKTSADRTDRETLEEILDILDDLGDDVKNELTEEKKKLDELEEEAVFDDDVSTFIEKHASKTNGGKIKKKSDITDKVAKKIVDGEQAWSELTPAEQDEVNRRLAPLTYETLLKYAKAKLIPNTGDSTNIALLAMLMLVALTGVILTGARKRSAR